MTDRYCDECDEPIELALIMGDFEFCSMQCLENFQERAWCAAEAAKLL